MKSVRLIRLFSNEQFIKLRILGLKNPSSQTIYFEIDDKLRKWFRFLNIFMVQMSPVAVTLPMFVTGIFAYHFTDLGRDAFALPFPIW